MRIPRATASLHAREGHETLPLRMGHDRRHHDFDLQLRTQRHHIPDDVWRILHKLGSHATVRTPRLRHRFTRKRSTHVQAMNVVHVVVASIPAIQGRPDRREPPHPNNILDNLVPTKQLLIHHTFVAATHPGWPPTHMLHDPLLLLSFVCPLHRRRPHIPSNSPKRVHYHSRLLLARHHFHQTCARHQLVTFQPLPHTSQQHALHSEAFPRSLRQQHSVHQSPHEPMLTMRAHALPCREAQHVLRVLLRTYLVGTRIIEVRDAHRKLQREGLRETTRLTWKRRLRIHAGPSELTASGGPPRDALRFLIRIKHIWGSLHSTAIPAATKKLRDSPQLHPQDVDELRLILNINRPSKVPVHVRKTPLG